MTEDKKIEEMAKDLCHTETCKIKKIEIPCYHRCKAHIYATRAIDKGYRKASDVAMEIFEEIEKSVANIKYTVDSPRYTHIPVETMVEVCNWILQECIPKRIAELKKKYADGSDIDVLTKESEDTE